MEGAQKPRNCLVCSVPITTSHLGIDSCRACSVFYKCNYVMQEMSILSIFGSNEQCTFDFTEELVKFRPVELRRTKEKNVGQTFIDHNTFHLEQPSCSDTPLLDKIRWSYSLLCLMRKTGETATKPVTYQISQQEFDGSEINHTPTTYSMIVPNSRIFASAMYEFAKMAFSDFSKMSSANKALCIENSFHQVSLIDSNYRSAFYFPNNLDAYLTSYTTILSDETINSFLNDRPYDTNAQEAIEALQVGMKRIRLMNREFFDRVKPDDVEFLALLGLCFWNNEIAIVSEELSEIVEKNRNAIIQELKKVYIARGRTDYATRFGQLFALLDNIEENVTLIQHDLEVYKLHNMFNEAFLTK